MTLAENHFLAIGLMSGTSMDGVDCALIESDGHHVKAVLKAVHIPYAPDFRHQIAQAMMTAEKLGHPKHQDTTIDHLERGLTMIHATAVSQVLKANDLGDRDVDVIGFHGQTLRHRPDDGWTWQIGDGQLLATESNIPVVNDFRRNDIKHGGQGAPLVPIYHQALLKNHNNMGYPVAILNIGGVGNITWINSDHEGSMLAFDTGPGNALLDDWIMQHRGEPMDRDGVISAQGSVNHSMITKWMENSYFYKTPPKSLDRQAFGTPGLNTLNLANGAATLLDFTVKSIEIALSHCPERPEHIYVCGGGRHNKTLMIKLGEMDIPVDPVEILDWQGDFMEAEAFAFLACRHLKGLPITFPGTTGVTHPVPGGILHKP